MAIDAVDAAQQQQQQELDAAAAAVVELDQSEPVPSLLPIVANPVENAEIERQMNNILRMIRGDAHHSATKRPLSATEPSAPPPPKWPAIGQRQTATAPVPVAAINRQVSVKPSAAAAAAAVNPQPAPKPATKPPPPPVPESPPKQVQSTAVKRKTATPTPVPAKRAAVKAQAETPTCTTVSTVIKTVATARKTPTPPLQAQSDDAVTERAPIAPQMTQTLLNLLAQHVKDEQSRTAFAEILLDLGITTTDRLYTASQRHLTMLFSCDVPYHKNLAFFISQQQNEKLRSVKKK
jgi:hypothetical protein